MPVHGRIQDARKTGNLPDGAKRGVGAGVLQPDGLGAGRNDNHLAMRCYIPRTAEPVFPGHASLLVLQPVLAAPAVAGKPHHLLDEVPRPADIAIGLECVDLRTERGKINPALTNDRSTENRLTTDNLLHEGPVVPIQDIVGPSCGAEVQVVARDGR